MIRAILLCLMLIPTAHANFITVTIDPDNYANGDDLTHAGAGATLYVYTNTGGTPPRSEGVVAKGVAGIPFSEPNLLARAVHVDRWTDFDFRNIRGAYECGIRGNPDACVGTEGEFGVLRMDFEAPTDFFELRTVMPEYASDGAFLFAFDSKGNRIVTCDVPGGPNLRLPRYSLTGGPSSTFGAPCGEVLVMDGNHCPEIAFTCDRLMTARVESAASDIAFVLWGGWSRSATSAMVDGLTYHTSVPEPGTAGLALVSVLGAIIFRRKVSRRTNSGDGIRKQRLWA